MDEKKIEALVSEFREFLMAKTIDGLETSTIYDEKDTFIESLKDKDPVWKRILIEDNGICICRWKTQGKSVYLEQELRNSEGDTLTIDSLDFDEIEWHRDGENYITFVLLHIPNLSDVWKKWNTENKGTMHRNNSPLPMPNDLTDLYSGEKIEPLTKFQPGEWVMCKVSIRLGIYIRYHFSKAWSAVIRECGQNLGINDESEFQKISPWGLRKKQRQNVILPMLITISKEGKNLKTNLPSWWKVFSPESKYGNEQSMIKYSRRNGSKRYYGVLQKRTGHNDARIGRRHSMYNSLMSTMTGKNIRGNGTVLVDVGFENMKNDWEKYNEKAKKYRENKKNKKKRLKEREARELTRLLIKENKGKKLTIKESKKLSQLKKKK